MKAIIIGVTGATGKELIKQLLLDDSYDEIKSFVRRKSTIQHPKLKEIIIDFEKMDTYKNEMFGDVAFSCLGTTLKAAGSKQAQWIVDYEFQLRFAQISKENQIETFVLISSTNAKATSSFYYMKMKGQLEDKIKALAFKRTIIFQPPSLIRPETDRKGEIVGMKVIQFLNKLGLLKKLEPLHVSDLAKAMIKSVKQIPLGIHTLNPSEIKKISNS